MNRLILTYFGFSCLIFTVLLTVLAFNLQEVRAQKPVYIRADGSVDPSSANITSSDFVTYSFTDNNFGQLTIERGNIVVDGSGYRLEGTGYGDGVSFRDISNITVKNLEITGFDNGVSVHNSSNNKFYGNNITSNNYHAFSLSDSSNSTFSENWIANNGGYAYHGYSAVYITYSSENTIYHNNISQNTYLEGIELWYSVNNNIFENNIVNNYLGITLFSSDNNHIDGNNITSSNYGLYLSESSNNTLSDNQLNNNGYGFKVSGYELRHYWNYMGATNLVDGKPVYYLINQNNLTVDPSTHPKIGYLAFINSTNINVKANHLTKNGQGLLLAYTNNSRITKNNITGNYDGLEFHNCFNNSIVKNNIVANEYQGLYLWDSNDNKIVQNSIVGNENLGLYLSGSSNNIVCGNTMANSEYAIEVDGSNNSIYHNNFINNTYQIESYGLVNFWDNGMEGNYWSDYTGSDSNQTCSGCQDGIGNTPYIIDENNNDSYPLMGVFSSFNTSLGKNLDIVSNSTIDGFEYELNSTIRFYVSNSTLDQSVGFCRVAIPKIVLPPPYDVVIDDGAIEVLYYYGLLEDNGTHRWIYFEYEHSQHKIEIIPEFPSVLLLPLLMMATLLSVIIYRRNYFST